MPSATDPITAKGHLGGSVSFDGQFVAIRRKGLNRLTVGKGEKRIHIASISAVQMKPAGPVMNGFIQFTVPGGVERRSSFGRQTPDAVKDENSVIFTRAQQPAFEQLRAAVDAAIAELHQHAQPLSASTADEIAKLVALRDSGAMTLEEFEAAKQSVLRRI
ncbi:DUF4429 domain-containing protein [Nocardia nova]|uniref:DUF4429 domain-containing protein n=1 Tax=Nocardia nova TaxID=37330 RepID=UPI0033EDFBC2